MQVNFLPVLEGVFIYQWTDMKHSQQNHRTLNHYWQGRLDDAGSILKLSPLFHLKQYCSCDQIEKNDTGGACSTYGEEERCMQDFGEETWGKEATWKSQAKTGG